MLAHIEPGLPAASLDYAKSTLRPTTRPAGQRQNRGVSGLDGDLEQGRLICTARKLYSIDDRTRESLDHASAEILC